jgi:hypothetical protein
MPTSRFVAGVLVASRIRLTSVRDRAFTGIRRSQPSRRAEAPFVRRLPPTGLTVCGLAARH